MMPTVVAVTCDDDDRHSGIDALAPGRGGDDDSGGAAATATDDSGDMGKKLTEEGGMAVAASPLTGPPGIDVGPDTNWDEDDDTEDEAAGSDDFFGYQPLSDEPEDDDDAVGVEAEGTDDLKREARGWLGGNGTTAAPDSDDPREDSRPVILVDAAAVMSE
ncbi:hypothetical protein HK405_011871, partial [Cladochytrium tenue]